MDLKGRLPEGGSSTHLLSYLPPDTVIVLWAPLEIAEQAHSYLARLPDERGIYPLSAVLKHAAEFTRLELSQFDQGATSLPGAPLQAPHVGASHRFTAEVRNRSQESPG